MLGQLRQSKVRSGHVKLGQVRSGQVRSGQVRSSQGKSVRFGLNQVMLGHIHRRSRLSGPGGRRLSIIFIP